jgi:hypothetical protein
MPSRHLYLCYAERKAANQNIPESERNRTARALIRQVQDALSAEPQGPAQGPAQGPTKDRSAIDDYHRILQRAARVFTPWRGPPAR